MLFQASDQLCERYTSLNPFLIRRERNGEVFMLINRIITSTNKKENGNNEQVIVKANGDKIIRREAKNDDWY